MISWELDPSDAIVIVCLKNLQFYANTICVCFRKSPKQSCIAARIFADGLDPVDKIRKGSFRDRGPDPGDHSQGAGQAQDQKRCLDGHQW